jgi:hypothetical protein
MNDNLTVAPRRRKRSLLLLASGILLFGILMGLREEFAIRWQRSLTAATAAVVLVLSVSQFRNPR